MRRTRTHVAVAALLLAAPFTPHGHADRLDQAHEHLHIHTTGDAPIPVQSDNAGHWSSSGPAALNSRATEADPSPPARCLRYSPTRYPRPYDRAHPAGRHREQP